ncbi:MAG: S1/P1 nuclease [Blastocatellia bacterium]
MKKIMVVLLSVLFCAGSVLGYGPRGHSLVGAIADRRLAKNKPVANQVKQLLDGMTLERAATLPDEIKSWDGCNRKPSTNQIAPSKKINDQLRAFWNANKCNSDPSHHEFHYTDVPVVGGEKYGDGQVGRNNFDIVKMIPFCVRVLKGQEPETNDRAITKAVAIILLAHYLGDIHQPLHVGAEYFNASLNPFEPKPTDLGFADQGGNKLTLFTIFGGKLTSAGKFHSYWDGQTVDNAFGTASNATTATKLAKSEPANWKLTGAAETWAEQLANEILPLAGQAHDRLVFKNIKAQAGAKDITSGRAEENKKPGEPFYANWAAATVKTEIHKAGWRLAALLEDALH